jgi:ferric-dicitrate binding protein FerR (iron transport regulator)
MNPSNQTEFEQLLERHLDGELSPEEGARFAQLLSEDPANARAFARASALHQQVRSMLKFERSVGAPIGGEGEGTGVWHSWPARSILLLTALTVLTGVWWISSRENPLFVASSKPSVDVPSIHILSGTTKLMLPNIGHVVVDGPAEFEMLDPMRARLNTGRIKMRVTEVAGHGFVVETPYGSVTDLGTEFGLDIPSGGDKGGLVVFDGEVDLEVNQDDDSTAPKAGKPSRVKRLVQGDGVTFDQRGQVERIGSIVTGTAVATFMQAGDTTAAGQSPLIVSVSDNRHASATSKFYEIVSGGLGEDAKSYVDRPHEWNGITENGMPPYLLGADYVKTFGTDRLEQALEIRVTIARPAKLYVFFDGRLEVPHWLTQGFQRTGDRIGLDGGRIGKNNPTRNSELKVGPGKSIDDRFGVWERVVAEPGTVVLGSPNTGSADPNAAAMYGIAAVPLSPVEETKKENVAAPASSRGLRDTREDIDPVLTGT